MERATAERFSSARTLTEIGETIADACERGLPFGTFGYAVFEPRVTEQPCMVIRSSEFSTEWLGRQFPELLMAIERDLGGLQFALSEHRAYDGYEKFPLESVRNLGVYQDHWRVYRCGQQFVAPVWHAGVPAGYFTICRAGNEQRLTGADLRFFEELRAGAEAALHNVTALAFGDLARTLDALSQAFPYPAFLFEPNRKLRWMSDEGAVRLEIQAAKLGSARLIKGSHGLEALSACAASLIDDPRGDADSILLPSGLIRPGERVALRRFGENGTTLVLLAITPAMVDLPGHRSELDGGALPNLGAAESRVARLAADGYTVLNIASQLGVSEATVRTHLHRVYVKLGVHSRAELATLLSRGRPR
jgi:DNA-binding CsgD family transcriptional regulator